MKLPAWIALACLAAWSLPNALGADPQPPLANNQIKAHENFQSLAGVPISDTVGVPPGSNGLLPPPPAAPAAPNQFQTLVSLGGTLVGTARARDASGDVALVARRTRIGLPIVGSAVTYLFGDRILPPTTDEYGVALSQTNANVTPNRLPTLPATYWVAEPYTTDGHTTGGYYWSPHAEAVYASQAGSVVVQWRRAESTPLVGSPPGVESVTVNNFPFNVLTVREVVAAVPSKPPRLLYWTEGPFAQLGRPISIPTDRIKDIKVVYNEQIRRHTDLVTVGTNQVRLEFPFDGSQYGPIAITNSVWYDRTLNSLRAYNFANALVFVEFLGDKRGQIGGQDIHQQLGFEIVDVRQRPTAEDVTTELGDPLTPFQGPAPAGTPTLHPDPIVNVGQTFAYRHSLAGTSDVEYYAIRETRNVDDYQMHWMEDGILDLRWPYRYVRYKMIWPGDVARYSHYVRPLAANEEEAKATAVALPAANAPQLVYQDPLDQPRGKLTETFAYYSFLDPAYPAHRALLQFNAAEHVRFERIFSWLDAALRDDTQVAVSPARYAADFESTPAGATLYGNAVLLNGFLRLTVENSHIAGGIVIDDFAASAGAVESFKATFRFRLSSSEGLPADGISFNFGTLPDGILPQGEEGTEDGLAVSFDVWNNGTNDYAPGIEIKLDGRHVAAVSMGGKEAINPGMIRQPLDPETGLPMVLATGPELVPVEIELSPGGLVDVWFKGVKVLQNVRTGYTPRSGRFGIFARTSGEDATQRIDDLVIEVNPPPPPRRFATDFGYWAIVAAFDGVDDHVVTSDARSAFNDDTVTIEVWFKADEAGVVIEEQSTTLTDELWQNSLIWVEPSGEVYVGVSSLAPILVGTVEFGTWHHVVLRYSQASQLLEGFLDGQLSTDTAAGNRTAPWEDAGNNGEIRYALGNADPGQARPYFKGQIDEFRVWSVERTITDIRASRPGALTGHEPGLALNATLDDAFYSSFYMADYTTDKSTNGFDVLMHGPVLTTSTVDDSGRVDSAAIYGNANVDQGILKLTDAVGSQNGHYVIEDFTETGNEPVEAFKATFMASLRDSTCCDGIPGDGFSFNFGTLPNGILAPGEEGAQEGLVVSFDLWDNGDNDYAPGIEVKLNGIHKGAVRMEQADFGSFNEGILPAPIEPYTQRPMTLTSGRRFVPVEIELKQGGKVDVSYKGVKVLENVETGYEPRPGRFGFAASTTTANSMHWIDDLSIDVTTSSFIPGAAFTGSVATRLDTWSARFAGFNWPSTPVRPRVVRSAAFVGQRIGAPGGELGSGPGSEYLAGYIQASQGDSYHAGAYIDPFASGFETARQGAVIPVNAIPGRNLLEVWWFRTNQVDATRGFQKVYWPSVMGRYTTAYPPDASEIILASNDGSGPLPSLEAKGSIYVQNNPALPGYNPNEEHALMQGGQAFALRDDLNLTAATVPAVLLQPGATFSSEPFVLLDYIESDGKPAMRPFHVIREKPEAGITFEFQKPAAQILQAPMPLPLLGAAFAPKIPGVPRKGLSDELVAWKVTASEQVPTNSSYWTFTTETTNGVPPYWTLVLQNADQVPPDTRWFLATNTTENTVAGPVSPHRPLSLGAIVAAQVASHLVLDYPITSSVPTPPVPAGEAFLWLPETSHHLAVTVLDCASCSSNVVRVNLGDAAALDLALWASAAESFLLAGLDDLADSDFNGWRLAWNELPLALADSELQDFYESATLTDRKGNVWVYRGPHREDRPESFAMRFYYNTLPGFYFPSLAFHDQPPAGTVSPYLRRLKRDGTFMGHPVFGNANADQEDDKNALPIFYHPFWPGEAPVLQMAETLTTPKRGLPAVRGQSSLEVLYQQSHIETTNEYLTLLPQRSSVVLHDPTREKSAVLDVNELPTSIESTLSRGKIYFPHLPPHLVHRFWLDPNRGPNGELVFAGAFVDAPLGDDYLMLNVAGLKDRTSLTNLVLSGDENAGVWYEAIGSLAADMDHYVENPAAPGTFIVDPDASANVRIGLAEVAAVRNDDVPVDSYALTAIGPGTGYVTLIAGNGSKKLTPEEDPVSMEVIRVVPKLYRGEVNVIESENPLAEKLTLQQVVDLAGRPEDYTFEWRITAPVDGQPPDIYTKEGWVASYKGSWSHVRHPLPADRAASIEGTAPRRVSQDVSSAGVIVVGAIPFVSVTQENELFRFVLTTAQHGLARGNLLVMSSAEGVEVFVTVHDVLTGANTVLVSVDPNQLDHLSADQIFSLSERCAEGQPQSIVYNSFDVDPVQNNLTEVWVGLALEQGLAAKVYIDGGLVVSTGFATPEDNTSPNTPSNWLIGPAMNRYFRLPASVLATGTEGPGGLQSHRVAVELFAAAIPGRALDFQVQVEAITSVDLVSASSVWLPLPPSQYEDGVRAIVGELANVQSLSDNYLTMRYVPTTDQADPSRWSQWTVPQLAEGWIKRVLKGINPFNQRITDLYNNSVNTDVSILAQAGARWEGNIALNLEAINDYGLIEIYETVLNRGRDLSIDADINYGPANDALLLAAGYINDLYMLVGNEAAADAANPTIGFGTADNTYGNIATALFAFRGQLPSLLAEELGLLRGRDDFLVPGVEIRPVYNRLPWNYTRGIDAGEVVYALNYNILDQNTDGTVDALDALKLYPQGHGDAYGHYLTALTGYYHLIMNPNFDWVPRSEAVLVLGKPVSVDYQDERKLAAAAGALARTGRQIFDLTWRQDYLAGEGHGWESFRSHRVNDRRTRYWGLDHWASRTAQGAYVNWIVGNAILPFQDPDPGHADTIQQVDRTTVPELKELPEVLDSLQIAMDNAESGLTPLGLPEDSVPFDLNPNAVVGGEGNTHFEQIYSRAKGALRNAVVAFDDAKDVTRLMRSEEDSLADLRAAVDKQELACTNALIEIYGTPYPEDIGPGKTYATGYQGPDFFHYMYVDTVELNFNGLLDPEADTLWRIDTQTFTADWLDGNGISDFNFIQPARNTPVDGNGTLEAWETNSTLYVEYNLAAHGFFKKPSNWVGRRASPGKIQQAISDIAKARNAAFTAFYWADAAKYDLDWALQQFQRKKASHQYLRNLEAIQLAIDQAEEAARLGVDIFDIVNTRFQLDLDKATDAAVEALPKNYLVGLSNGGDLTSGARSTIKNITGAASVSINWEKIIKFSIQRSLEYGNQLQRQLTEFNAVATEEWNQELRESMDDLRDAVYGMNNEFMTINARLQELDDARRHYRTLLAEGDRIRAEREIFRNRTAAVIHGYRTRDAAFRIFRNEKLERYKSLFDLAARYAFMAAKAYDYETGLLGTDEGRKFIQRIVNARALGVVQNGEPQFGGSNTGDPGLSSVLAEMHADWSVVKSRLGFNNPDAYGTTASLSYENYRIITNHVRWQDVMSQARRANLLDDPDVRRYCLQIDDGSGLTVPGLVFEFETTIANGLNLFGHPLSPGDHKFSASLFATKIFAAGVALEGYIGMDDPAANSGAVQGADGTSPSDPSLVFLDPNALAANPYIYLIPVGVDSMRSPPLGDESDVRTWTVNDVAIPLPFNIGGSDFSTVRLWQSEDSLTEQPFTLRKHQAFRPVSSATVFDPSIYTVDGGLQRSQFTNNRLIGRSVWNSKWKIIIPGRELLADPNEGIERFLRTVKDIKLHFVTYSYSGN